MSNMLSEGWNSVNSYQRAEQEFQMKKQLQQAQTMKAMADVNEMDIKKIGESAFLKIGQGIPLTPQETAAAKFLDAKSGLIMFDPTTGAATKKPSLFDKMPLNGGVAPNITSPTAQPTPNQNYTPMPDNFPPESAPIDESRPFENKYNQALKDAVGNPKLQQSISAEYQKSKTSPNDSEKNAAGFAQRMKLAEYTLNDPRYEKAATNTLDRALSNLPIIGNKLTAGDFQVYQQAKNDLIAAQLRKESGSAIGAHEMQGAEDRYAPVYGDQPATLALKKAARDELVKAMTQSAGASYEGTPTPANPHPPKESFKSASEPVTVSAPKKPSGYDADNVAFKLLKTGKYTKDQVREYLTNKGM